MLKKIAAYGVIAAGAAGFMMSAGAAQASEPFPAPSAQTASPYGAQDGPQGSIQSGPQGGSIQGGPQGSTLGFNHWRMPLRNLFFIRLRKNQTNEANNFTYACDTHAAAALDHQLMGQNQENGKCAQSSFNDN